MLIVALDPGTTESAVVVLDPDATSAGGPGRILRYELRANEHIRESLIGGPLSSYGGHAILAYEMVASYGMAVGASVFETVFWCGRLVECWQGPARRVFRAQVKSHLCRSQKAKDGNIRQALIDRWGGEASADRGKKCPRPHQTDKHCSRCDGSGWLRCPGPLAPMVADLWAALAVAVTAAETPA